MKNYNAKIISLYGLLTAAALLFGYVEYLVPLNFIAPGVKLGIANGVVLMLILSRKIKAATAVNIIRILLSALLFGSPFSLLFSLSAGIISMLAMVIVCRNSKVGFIGISVIGGVVHNLTQLFIAQFTVGQGVWFYLPFLLITGVVAGIAVGFLTWIILRRTSNIISSVL